MTDRAARAERRRGLAKRVMDVLTLVCIAVAVTVGASQLAREGIQEFFYRPPGIGASPSNSDTAAGAPGTKPVRQQLTASKTPRLPDADMLGLTLVIVGGAVVGAVLLLGFIGRIPQEEYDTL